MLTSKANKATALEEKKVKMKRGVAARRYKNNKLWNLRIIIVICLVATAALVGWGAYYFLTTLLLEVEKAQYDAVVAKLSNNVNHRVSSTVTLLYVLRDAMIDNCPDVSMWPNCGMKMSYFAQFTNHLLRMISMRTIAFAPMVLPSQITSFETFAYQFLADNNRSDLGISDFGQGIYGVRNGSRYRMTNATTNGKHDFLFPIFEAGDLPHNTAAIMYNIYDEIYRVTSIDHSIDCITLNPQDSCTTITDIIHLVQDPEFRPAGLITLAFKLNEADTVIRGVVYTAINWDIVMSEGEADKNYANHIDAVLSTGVDEYSFRFIDGIAVFSGRGDLHNERYNSRKHTTTLNQLGSTTFSISFYPTTAWFESKQNSTETIFVITFTMGIMFLMSTVLYDQLINRQNADSDLVMNTKRQFVRYISHEIRTPLNVVHLALKVLYTEMVKLLARSESSANQDSTIDSTATIIKMSDPIAETLQDWLILISETETNSDNAIEVLNDLLNYDRIDTGTLRIELNAVYMWDIITAAVVPFYVQAKHSGVALSLDLEIKRPNISVSEKRELKRLLVLGDNIKLSQVVKNLISNSLKFTSTGGKVDFSAFWNPHGLPNVEIDEHEGYQRCGSLVLTCKDTGAGLSPENIKGLFQEGVQFNANVLQAGQGSGLGLCIAKGIIELHNGTITATSEGLGKGAEFIVELPCVTILHDSSGASSVQSADDAVEEMGVLNEGKVGQRFEGFTGLPKDRLLHVLVVDDVAVNRKVSCRLLRGEGVVCFEAVDGQDCVDYMKRCSDGLQENVDVILMDYEMPRMNGPTATEVLRSMGCDVPIIGVTGNALSEDKQFFIDSGAACVVCKPVEIRELHAAFLKLNLPEVSEKGLIPQQMLKEHDETVPTDDNVVTSKNEKNP